MGGQDACGMRDGACGPVTACDGRLRMRLALAVEASGLDALRMDALSGSTCDVCR